jgi:riboflavin synthase alpha subunit
MYKAEILQFTQSNYNHGKTNSTQGICLTIENLSKILSIHIPMSQKNSTDRARLDEVC